MKDNAKRMSITWNKNKKEADFKVGDMVLWRNPAVIKNKTGRRWTGPFRISKIISPLVVNLQLVNTPVNVRKLKKFFVGENTHRKFAIGDKVKIFWSQDKQFYSAILLEWIGYKAKVQYCLANEIHIEPAHSLRSLKGRESVV